MHYINAIYKTLDIKILSFTNIKDILIFWRYSYFKILSFTGSPCVPCSPFRPWSPSSPCERKETKLLTNSWFLHLIYFGLLWGSDPNFHTNHTEFDLCYCHLMSLPSWFSWFTFHTFVALRMKHQNNPV